MNTPLQQPDEREPWLRGESFSGFQTAEERRATAPWAPDTDPLNGPLPGAPQAGTPGGQTREPEAPPGAGEPGLPEDPYPTPEAPRQHAERVPRYTGSAAPVSPPPLEQPGAEPRRQPGLGAEPPTQQGLGAGPPTQPGLGAEPRTNILPTVAGPVSGQPASGHAAPPLEEPGIPASLAPMLSREDLSREDLSGEDLRREDLSRGDRLYGRHTERISRQPGYPPAGPAPVAPPQPDRSGRPEQASGSAAVRFACVLATLLAMVPSLLLLYAAVFEGDGVSAPGAVGGTLMLIGLPMLAAGLYPILSGRFTWPTDGARSLARAPLAYLLVGLTLLLAAGLAV